MQKKQIIQFAALLVAILALAGACIGIQSYHNSQEEEKSKKEAASIITLTSFGPDSVTAIRYDVDGTECAFEKGGEGWQDAGNHERALDQDAFEEFLQKAGSITSDTKVQAQEGEDYGFSAPTRTVAITTVKGTSSLIFGMENEMLGQYYVKTSESNDIYLVEESAYTAFEKTAEDFEKAETEMDGDEGTVQK